jgi:hypothetical protein
MNILWWHFNAKVERKDIFQPTFKNDSLHESSDDKGVRVINFVTSKTIIAKSTMFSHHNIHTYTWKIKGDTQMY